MAILRSRDELLPVTCAVLKDEVREKFFGELKDKAGGKIERIAKACGTTVANINNWAKGNPIAPYHALQLLASEFGVEMPEVTELRREFRATEGVPQNRRPVTKQKPSDFGPSADERQEKPVEAEPPRQGKKQEKPSPLAGPAGPDKLTEERAYWTGVFLARGRRDQTHIRLVADRQMSQNFAATWAALTHQSFGVRPELVMSEDRTEQTASLPVEKMSAFLERIDFPAGTEAAPGAPRWAWSKAVWKDAFIKGVVDASAHFHRTPELKLTGLSERLLHCAQKMLSSVKVNPKLEDGVLCVQGEEAIRTYFETIGTDNPKLKDQINAYFKGKPPIAEKSAVANTDEPQRPDRSRRSRRRSRRGRNKKE